MLVWICQFPLPLGVWEGLRFVIVALPGLFSYLFFFLYFPNFSIKNIRYGYSLEALAEGLLMVTHSICSSGEMRKIFI